jgi:penicillin-binding protein 2
MIRGLFDVYNLGTASTLRVEGIDIAGKTGTAENFAKIDGKRVQLKDHSILSLPQGQPENRHCHSGGKWRVWSNDSGTNCQLNDRKYRKKITRTDLETRVLNISKRSIRNTRGMKEELR